MIDPASIVGALPAIVHLLAQVPAPDEPTADDDFAPMMLVVSLIAVAVCLVLIGIGIVLALVGAVCTAALVAFGIVSASVVLALLRRRASAGVRALHYQICALIAAPAGVLLLGLASAWFNLGIRWNSILPLGALAGIVAGLLVAGVGDWAARLAYRRLLPALGSDAATAASLPG